MPRRKPMKPDRKQAELTEDPNYAQIGGVSHGQAAQLRAEAMGLPEPTIEIQHLLLAHSRESWEIQGPGILSMVWENLDEDGNDTIVYLTPVHMREMSFPPGIITMAEELLAEMTDPSHSFILLTYYPKMNGLIVIRSYTIVLRDGFVVPMA